MQSHSGEHLVAVNAACNPEINIKKKRFFLFGLESFHFGFFALCLRWSWIRDVNEARGSEAEARTLEAEAWTREAEAWALEAEAWTLEAEAWTLEAEAWTVDTRGRVEAN